MEMEFINILRVIWHWRSLIISMLIVATIALVIRIRVVDPMYEADVMLQLNTPQIANMDGTWYADSIDLASVARNNLTQVILSSEIYDETVAQLALAPDQLPYEVQVNPVQNSDFIQVIVRTKVQDSAVEIANTHVKLAVEQYGVLRAKPANDEKDLLYTQLQAAEDEYNSSLIAFSNFKSENEINSLESDLLMAEDYLQRLKYERDREIFDRDAAVDSPQPDITAEANSLIAEREHEIQRIRALEPTYTKLDNETRQALDRYEYIMGMYNQAQLKAVAIQATTFIQVTDPAETPMQTGTNIARTLIIPLIGCLGFAILVAFLLEYLLGLSEGQTRSLPTTKSEVPLTPYYGAGNDPKNTP
jgi:uncharacterized protein involved in exopolysaccharide biosynthesis